MLLPGTVEIESVYFSQANEPVASLRSAGLHPWYLHTADLNTSAAWLRDQAVRREVIAIGEAGLDKVTSTPWEVQVAAFQLCADIAEEFRKPLVVHCVRAFGEILALKKQWKPEQAWVFHGFDKNVETARSIWSAGCRLSFGTALFRQNSAAAEALRQVPADRFFLETDVSDVPIEKVYEKAAEIRGIALQDLKRQLQENFLALFGGAGFINPS